jgi:hypothetical protein
MTRQVSSSKYHWTTAKFNRHKTSLDHRQVLLSQNITDHPSGFIIKMSLDHPPGFIITKHH